MENIRKTYLNLLKAESDSIMKDEGSLKSSLTESGYDYVKLQITGKELASKLLLKAKAAVVRAEQQEQLAKIRVALSTLGSLTERNLDKLQSLFQQKFGQRYALNFRELKEMNADEAASILSDIEVLEFLEGLRTGTTDEKP
jgi:hypothetical protein